MITAVPWDVFAALVVLELVFIVALRIGWSAVGSLRTAPPRAQMRRATLGTE